MPGVFYHPPAFILTRWRTVNSMSTMIKKILTSEELDKALKLEDRIELCKRRFSHCISQQDRDEIVDKINEYQHQYYDIVGELYQQHWYTGV